MPVLQQVQLKMPRIVQRRVCSTWQARQAFALRLSDTAKATAEGISSGIGGIGQSIQDTGSGAAGKLGEMREGAMGKASEVTQGAKETTGQAAGKAQEAGESAKTQASETAGGAKARTEEAGQKATDIASGGGHA